MPRTGERNADRGRKPSLWEPPPGGAHGKPGRLHASARSVSAEPVHGTNATDSTSEGRPVRRTVGSVEQGRGAGEPPQLARRTTVLTVPDRCFGLVRGSVTAPCGNGPGNRYRAGNAASPAEPPGTTGDVRSSERLTPAGRPSVDGSSHLELPWAAQRLRPQRSRGSSLFPFPPHLGVILAKPASGRESRRMRRDSRPVR